MPDFREAFLGGLDPSFQKIRQDFHEPLKNKNPAASNFLNAFLGRGLNFKDESGSVTLDPRSGSFTATPKNSDGVGFTFNPLGQSASISKGSWELSGGLGDAPIGGEGYGPTNEQMMTKFSQQGSTPWVKLGFRFPSPKNEPVEEVVESQESPRERQFANPGVKELLERTTSKVNSGRDLYNPSSW
jgi:hypothetical protein